MGKISSIFQGILLSTSIFLIYIVDKNIYTLSEQSKNITILSEEIRMSRNYIEYNKVKSNNLIISFCNIKNILDNPMQFILFLIHKNNELNVLNDPNINKIIMFISHCASDNIKRDIVNIEYKIMNLFKDKNQKNILATEMLISIIRRYKFDIFLYPQKLNDVLNDWYNINKFILNKADINKSDIKTIIKFIMLYKLSESLYL